MDEKRITAISILAGTGSSLVVAVPVALLIAFATGFMGVMGQWLAKWILKKCQKSKYHERYYK